MTLGKNELQPKNPSTRPRNLSQYTPSLPPLQSQKLPPCTFSLKRCRFEVLKDHSVELEIFNKEILFKIASNSNQIEITNKTLQKTYNLNNLPLKYHKFYQYGHKICEMLRSKTPKASISNPEGEFFLMENDDFEAFFTNGLIIYLKDYGKEFRVIKPDGKVFTKENYDKGEVQGLKKAILYMKNCLKRS